MSSRSLPVRLSKKARQDFIDILRYTGQSWGPNQLETYRDKIDDALQAISRNPELGHKREDLPTTHRAYLVGAHVVVYRLEDQGIGVVRILHQRMSLARHV
ncbi:MAG: type II toxin-antitoxin system RelE/ParE family toxin [Betaproteobacteria bacterium]|jgi:toxin ParE1/3/4